MFRLKAQVGDHRVGDKTKGGIHLSATYPSPFGTVVCVVLECGGCGSFRAECEFEAVSDADDVGNGVAIAAVDHGLPFEPVFLIIERDKNKGGALHLVGSFGGVRELARVDEEGGICEAEGSVMSSRASAERFSGTEKEY